MIFVFSALAIVILTLAVTVVVLVYRQAHSSARTEITSAPPQTSLSQPLPLTHSSATPETTVPGSVEGGAWIIKGGGQSDVLRGLVIYVISRDIDSTSIEAVLRELRKQCSDSEKNYSDMAEEYSNPGIDMRKYVPFCRERQNFAKECGKKVDSILTSKSRLERKTLYDLVRVVQKNDSTVGMGNVVAMLFWNKLELDKEWPAILDLTLLQKGQTGIDGKYAIPDVKPGECFLYAQTSSSFYFVEWFLPVKVTSGRPTKIDLFNENAALAINKE